MICSNRASDLIKPEQREQHPSSAAMMNSSMKGSRHGLAGLGLSGDAGDGSRSCLVLPGYLTKDKRKRQQQRRNRYGGIMLQSSHSTESASQHSQSVNDRSSLLPHGGNKSLQTQRLLWMSEDDDEKSEDVDSFRIGSAPVTPTNKWSTSAKTNGPVTPTPSFGKTDEKSNNIGLLSFPTPQDRSHKQRLKLERESRRKAVYDGELEPEGVRGEEAQLTPSTKASTPSSLPLRSFDEPPQSSGRLGVVNTSNHSNGSDYLPAILAVTPSPARSNLTERSSGQKPIHVVPPSDISTTSSQDIEQMIKDFNNEKETGDEQQYSILNLTPSTSNSQSSSHPPRLAPPPPPRTAREMNEVAAKSQAQSLLEASTPAISPSHRPDIQGQRLRPITPPRNRSAPTRPAQERVTAAEEVYRGIGDPDNRSHTTPSTKAPTRTPPRTASTAASPASAHAKHQAKSFSPNSGRNESGSVDGSHASSFRRSAPVDIDNTSFIHPNENVEGINAMAIEHVLKGEYDMALHAFGQVLQVYQREFGNPGDGQGKVVAHPLVASTYHNLGTVHSKRSMLFLDNSLAQRTCRDQALLCFQAAARAARDSLGPTHPNVAVSLVRIGFLLLQARQYHNAVVTFEEALRIRVAHYGGGRDGDSIEPHALIANVYNNLGVCHMHLEEFDIGRRYLDKAVRMQQALMRTADGVSSEAFRTQLLELADTLCNIGGLCLEWIRKQGPDARHAMDAESSFLEALEIRTKVLGPNDPLVLQVRSLHDMVRAMPLPKATTDRHTGPIPSPGHRHSSNAGSGSNGIHSYGRIASPRRLPLSPGRPNRTGASPGASPGRNGYRPTSQADGMPGSRIGKESTGLDLPTLKNNRRNDSSSGSSPLEPTPPPKVVRRSLSPSHRTPANNGSHRDFRNESYVTATSLGRGNDEGMVSHSMTTPSFTPTPEPAAITALRKERAKQVAPKDLTRVFLSPQFVPKTAPSTSDNDNGAFPNDKDRSFGSHPTDDNGDDQRVSESLYSYDPEENLVLSNKFGLDPDSPPRSRDGHVDNNDPFPWSQYSQLPKKTEEESSDVSTSILVVQPYDRRRQSEGQRQRRGERNSNSGASSPPRYKDMTSSWSSTISNTGSISSVGAEGVEDRMACLLRAKAILEAHRDFVDSPTLRLEATNTAYEPSPNEKRGGRSGDQIETESYDEDFGNDDGLAPLGGKWPAPSSSLDSENSRMVTSEMLSDPERHLRSIHICAVHYLKNNRIEESLQLFELVLDCQRLRHGTLHEDVAAALYNVGIANLRMERTKKALQAFEESVRLRKGALGNDHPLVAVSLVKVGITLLLLQQFKASVSVFQEALSVRKNALGALHPSTARIYNNLGCVHVEFNELREARRAFEAALDIQRNALSDDPQSGPIQFAAATTLCNLGYLYRNQEMHEKAALVLREALELQENVMGMYDPAVLSTLDNLAEACTLSNHHTHALKYYNEILERFHRNNDIRYGASKRQKRAEAVLLYKMSRVHFQQKDFESQLGKLKLALRSVRAVSVAGGESHPEKEQREYLETHIQRDMRVVRKHLEKSDIPPWV